MENSQRRHGLRKEATKPSCTEPNKSIGRLFGHPLMSPTYLWFWFCLIGFVGFLFLDSSFNFAAVKIFVVSIILAPHNRNSLVVFEVF